MVGRFSERLPSTRGGLVTSARMMVDKGAGASPAENSR